MVTIRNNFHTIIQETLETLRMNMKTVTTYIEAAAKCIPTKLSPMGSNSN